MRSITGKKNLLKNLSNIQYKSKFKLGQNCNDLEVFFKQLTKEHGKVVNIYKNNFYPFIVCIRWLCGSNCK